MGLGIYKRLNRIYTKLLVLGFEFRKFLLGFENANVYLSKIDKRAIIPILRKYNAVIGSNCDIESGLIFHNCKDYSNFIVGNNCHIGKNCLFDLRGKVILENNIVISMQSTFITHIDMLKSDLSKMYPEKQKRIKINNNCYIGGKSTIIMSVELGKNSIITAGAVVTKDVESYTMVGGVPAKLIKRLNKKEYVS